MAVYIVLSRDRGGVAVSIVLSWDRGRRGSFFSFVMGQGVGVAVSLVLSRDSSRGGM